ncbi:hypothetical protein CEXT_260261 [Caerostris extrusa]|uniref:Uncharacterized protein n=1 Tax=Caerostris extrusa TaxID=172846 RepID=A0AAV4QVQ1_CAEEX|nr:hypothetical protein CEXT_260261 [Caerostris extrusa]
MSRFVEYEETSLFRYGAGYISSYGISETDAALYGLYAYRKTYRRETYICEDPIWNERGWVFQEMFMYTLCALPVSRRYARKWVVGETIWYTCPGNRYIFLHKIFGFKGNISSHFQ